MCNIQFKAKEIKKLDYTEPDSILVLQLQTITNHHFGWYDSRSFQDLL